MSATNPGDGIDIGAMVAHADRDYPALFQLCGGYFHQDWTLEYADWTAAVSTFVEEAPPHLREDAISDIARVLMAGLSDADLDRLLYPGLGCSFLPDAVGMDARSWLRSVADNLQHAAGA